MKRILIVFGTRPETIKMAPIIKEMRRSRHLTPITCASGQHAEMLQDALDVFEIKPDHELHLMKPNQDLFDITINGLAKLKELIKTLKPDMVLVQGDTTTAFIAALASYYFKIPVGHVEAGLRTWDKYAPFPEEINRQLICPIADFHFAPTSQAVGNLLSENIPAERIFETGNTSIDALKWAASSCVLDTQYSKLIENRKLILMTAHRRENFGKPLEEIFRAVKHFADLKKDYYILYPVHPNPNVQTVAQQILGQHPRISLVDPLDYKNLTACLKLAHFVITDSGGLQEEAPTLGKPVLVFRESTERPEAVEAGTAKLVGHNPELILELMLSLASDNSLLYQAMSGAKNPFGDGKAAKRIVSILETEWALKKGNPIIETRRRNGINSLLNPEVESHYSTSIDTTH